LFYFGGGKRGKTASARAYSGPIADKLAERIRATLAGGMSVRKTAAKFDVNPSVEYHLNELIF
jgi:hypothetical protein